MSEEQQKPSPANQLEAQAKARKLEAEATKAERELPGAAELAAKARKAIAEADRDAASAQKEQLAALIPDLGSVAKSSLEGKEGEAFLAPFLIFGALEYVAENIASRVYPRLAKTTPPRVLVTTDPDLTSADALYREVTDGLGRLQKSAADLLSSLEPKNLRAAFTPATALAAIASAVPGILSLFSAQRTLTTSAAAAPDSLAAAAAVISALHAEKPEDSIVLVLDDFRLVPDSSVHAASRALAVERDRLVGKKLASGLEQDAAELVLVRKQREQAALAKETAPKDAKAHAHALEQVLREIDDYQQTIDRTTRDIGLIDALLTGVDSFTAAVGAMPAGARRSALTTAALHEQLRGATSGEATPDGIPAKRTEPAFSHVLLVKAQAGRSQQLLDNRPLWFNDKFSTLVEIGVTYVLISTATSGVLASGTATRIARAYGEIGQPPQLGYLDEKPEE